MLVPCRSQNFGSLARSRFFDLNCCSSQVFIRAQSVSQSVISRGSSELHRQPGERDNPVPAKAIDQAYSKAYNRGGWPGPLSSRTREPLYNRRAIAFGSPPSEVYAHSAPAELIRMRIIISRFPCGT